MIYCRAYINYEFTEMYQMLFHKVFDLMKARTGKSIKWNHIHSEGLKYVVMNMNNKQYSDK
jgi:NADH/NAD ratio-sensing transcriptional regulator Rex